MEFIMDFSSVINSIKKCLNSDNFTIDTYRDNNYKTKTLRQAVLTLQCGEEYWVLRLIIVIHYDKLSNYLKEFTIRDMFYDENIEFKLFRGEKLEFDLDAINNQLRKLDRSIGYIDLSKYLI